jgi:carboxylesterase
MGVLVVHGFTGNPGSMRGIADSMANAGFSVEMPLLPGHGTALEDMIPTRFDDYAVAAEAAYSSLAARAEAVVVVGLSMGGTLSCWLAEHHPEIAGVVVVNPLVEPVADQVRVEVLGALEMGLETVEAIGSDIAKPGVHEASYPGTPLRAALSLFDAVEGVSENLSAISCPVLVFTSLHDHVVPPSSSAHLVAQVSGPCEQVILEESYHVATLDFDAERIEVEAVAFVERLAKEHVA